MRFRLIAFLILILVSTINGQQQTSTNLDKDSLRLKFWADSNEIYKDRPITLFTALDFRNAYTNDRFLSFVGPQIGVTVHQKHTYAIGFYFLNKWSPFQSDKYFDYTFEKLNYFTLIYQYKIFDFKFIDLIAPIEIGYGSYRAEDASQGEDVFIESAIVPLGAGLRCRILPHKWVGFKIGVGYRYVYEVDSDLKIDGLFFSFGIRIDLRHVHQDYSYYRLKKRYNIGK